MQSLSDGRIRRTESEWRGVVASFESSGLSEVAFCRKAKVTRKTFRIWRARLTPVGSPPRILATRRPRATSAAFVEWLAPSSSTSVSTKPGAGTEFELALPGGVVVRWRA